MYISIMRRPERPTVTETAESFQSGASAFRHRVDRTLGETL